MRDELHALVDRLRGDNADLVVEVERLKREREELADLLGDMANTDCTCGDCFRCKARRYVVHECHDGDCLDDGDHDCHSSMCREGQPFVMRPASHSGRESGT